jgi:hypothetical protein
MKVSSANRPCREFPQNMTLQERGGRLHTFGRHARCRSRGQSAMRKRKNRQKKRKTRSENKR